jgi:hypothetical protein
MARLISWGILVAVALIATEGISLIRDALLDRLADPHAVVGGRILLGIILSGGGLWFLGGFIYYRDRKRGLIRTLDGKRKKR